MESMPSYCRCCQETLPYGGKLCESCRQDLSSSLYDVPKLLQQRNDALDYLENILKYEMGEGPKQSLEGIRRLLSEAGR